MGKLLRFVQFFRQSSGFALLELVIVVAIIATLSSTSIVSYEKCIDWAKEIRARYELNLMALALDLYYVEHGRYPDVPSLAGIKWPHVGPWGEVYSYNGNGTEYVLFVRDGGGRVRLEVRGKGGVSEVLDMMEGMLRSAAA